MDRPSLNNRGAQGIAAAPDSALACDIFDKFCNASTLKTILGYHRQLCDAINTRPNHFPAFYPKLKQYVNSWRAKALWKKFDLRASHKCYARGKACPNTRVLIVGGGPCGLRTAIEAQLLGAKVVVIEKRDRMSRNNVLHLWPFVIEDLRALGAKKFFGKFCAGAIDHISIRQIQCILLKVALLLGVEIHTEVSFMKLLPPPSKEESQERIGWRGMFCPADHPVSQYEFDVLIGADGRRNTLEGFKRKEFRGRLAIAITANFINKRTEAEARVEEISGVAFIFNQKFFKDLYEATGIDLENIVYYKDDTHYFVMTAKKQSLLEKGVIINDIPDTSKLLSRENVDVDALQNYAREAADFSTQYQMPDLEFAVNHYGNPDVNMFDFTSMYAAENASKVLDRHGHRLLMTLVGDSLLEPFWPTGSGCARGFLSSMDACWALRAWGSGTMTPLEVLAERESIYRLLGQTTPENLQRDSKSYTLDPSTRYPNLNKNSLLPAQVVLLFDTDNPDSLKAMQSATPAAPQVQELHKKRRRKDSQVHPDTLLEWLKRQIVHYEELSVDDLTTSFKDGFVLCAVIHRYRPDLLDFHALKKDDVAQNNQLAFDILEKELGISPVMTGQEMEECVIPDLLTMLSYLTQIYDTFRGEIPHIKHPKLDLPEPKKIERLPVRDFTVPNRTNITANTAAQSRVSARHKRHAEIPNAVMVNLGLNDRKARKRRSQDKVGASVDRDPKFPGKLRGEKDEEFSGRIKDFEDKLRETIPQEKKPKDLLRAIGKIETTDWNVREIEKKIIENKMGKSGNREKERVPKWSNEQFLARRTKMEKKGIDRQDSEDKKYAAIDKSLKQLDQKLKEGTVRELKQNKVSAITEQFKKQPEPEVAKPIQKSSSKVIIPAPGGSENCHFCAKRVYLMERLSAEGRFFHRGCFRCQYCSTMLRLGSYLFDRDGKYGHKFYCSQHFGMSGQLKGSKVVGKSKPGREHRRSPDKTRDIGGADFIDRVNTPERIEFSNMSGTGGISDLEESVSQMDEDEWTDRNFGASTAEIGSSDESSESDSESEDDEVFEEALEEPITKEGTHRIAKEWVKRYSKDHELDDSDSPVDYDTGSDFSYESTSDDDESDTATEGEEEIRARELRKEEVRVKQPIIPADTGSDTELASDEETSASSSDKENSATDIPTDSEFDHDDRTPTSEIPAIMLNDMNITKTRGTGGQYYPVPKKVQVKSGELQRPQKSGDIELKFVPLKPTNAQKPTTGNPDLIKPSALVNPRKGDYLLNRTQSTGGIASKVSLELKKRYLLGNNGLAGNIQRSGSTTTLDSKFKSFNSKISEHQKLLNPAPEISPTMQAFLQGTSKIHVPLSPTLNPKSPTFPQKQIIDLHQEKPICTPENHIKTNQKALIFDPVTKFDHICALNKAKSELKSPEIIDLTLSPNDKFAMQPDITKDLLPEDTKTETYESPQILEEPPKPDIIFNEVESRPRSPVHETSIIVPEIPWVTNKKTSEIDSDSLSSSESDMVADKSIGKVFSDIPRVQVHDTSGELLQDDDIVMDSLCIIPDLPEDNTPISEVPKSIQSEKKKLNQPKLLPGLEGLECAELTKTLLENKMDGAKINSGINLDSSEPRRIHSDESGLPKFHLGAETINYGTKLDQSGLPKFILGTKFDDGALQTTNLDDDKSSGRNTPISESDSICNDLTTAALTETELSDWARDGAVSDNLDDVEFDINPQSKSNKRLKSKKKRSDARIAMGEDFEDTGHICGKKLIEKSPERLPNGAPIADLDSIEYMDTGSEVSLEENCVETTNSGLLKNRGYIHFVNEVETVKHKPIEVINNNEPVEAVNKNVLLPLSSADQNTGYCVYGNENENQIIEVIKDDKAVLDNIDDAVEAGTTTEETTISDSTVKNMISEPKVDTPEIINEEAIKTPVIEGVEYDEHVKRLQSKYAEFGYVRDSIDIRKSKRKSLSPPTTESNPTGVTSPSFSSPATSRKLEEINKARSKQHDLIRDLVLDKVKLSKKPDKKRRIRESYSPSCSPVRRNFELTKSATVDITPIPRKLSPQLTDYTSKPVDLPQSDDFTLKSINIPNLTNISPKSSNTTPILTNIYSNPVNVTPNSDIITPKSVNTSKTVNSTSKSVNIISKSVDSPLSNSPLTDFSPSIGFVPKSLDFNSKSPQILRTESLRLSEKLYPIQRSPTISGVPLEKENLFPNHRTEFYTPVTSLKDLNPKTLARPLSMHGSFIVSTKPLTSPNFETVDTFSLPDFENVDDFKMPRAPPRLKHEEAKKSAEKLKHDARTRARLMSDEDLGLSPEDKLNFHRLIAGKLKKSSIDESIQESIESLVKNTDKRNAMLLTDTLNQPQLKQKSFSDIPTKLSLYKSEDNIERTKSVSEICKTLNQSQSFAQDQLKMSHSTTQINKTDPDKSQFYKSDPNLLTETGKKEKKPKDRERRKSIIKSMTEFFQKKKDSKSPNSSNSSGSVKDRFSRFRISPKSKDKSKDQNLEAVPVRSKSLCENSVKGNVSPPPIPPPPLNYSGNSTRDDSGSDGDCDWKKLNNSSDNLDQSCAIDGSGNSLGRRRCSRSLRKASKQAQIKRHRLAQEIQRKLEETEVKTRELEQRGVNVEKALRGEATTDDSSQREEEDLLREWFDLMRDRTELRRYEKELLVRAQELELEDRHARLQQELRDRLAGDDERKTQEDVAAEGAILSEMLEIVAKRDSLVAILEEDRQRCCLSSRRRSAPQLFAHNSSSFSNCSYNNNNNATISLFTLILTLFFAYMCVGYLLDWLAI